MSDYTKTTNFTAKDALSSGDPLKLIKGSLFDTEFDAIATAIATKHDSSNIASTAEAQALTSDTVLITPSGLNDVLTENAGMLGDIQALADPGADTVLGWDDSASAAISFTLGAGLSHAATELNVADAIAGAGLTISSSVLAVGAGNGITVNANDVALTDVTAGANNPVNISSGTVTLDITALDAVTDTSGLAATDTVVIDDSGTAKKVALQDMGMRVQLAQTTQTLAAGDMNSIMEFTGTATLTLPLNATTALPVGVPVVLNMKHATQELTVTAAASVTLVSIFHPGGTAAASDTVSPGGTALLFKTAADVWCITGDIST